MAREDPQFRLRLPDELKQRVSEAAIKSRRSLNAEIVERLDRSFYEATEDNFLAYLSNRPFFTNALPPGLAGRIQSKADAIGRSLEEEVIQALEKAYPPPPTPERDREMAEWLEQMAAKEKDPQVRQGFLNYAKMARELADEKERPSRGIIEHKPSASDAAPGIARKKRATDL